MVKNFCSKQQYLYLIVLFYLVGNAIQEGLSKIRYGQGNRLWLSMVHVWDKSFGDYKKLF